MKNNDGPAARKLFGEIAVHKGYCHRRDIDHALKIQRKLSASGSPPKMLGLIMLEEGLIDNTQLIDLVVELNKLVHDADA